MVRNMNIWFWFGNKNSYLGNNKKSVFVRKKEKFWFTNKKNILVWKQEKFWFTNKKCFG